MVVHTHFHFPGKNRPHFFRNFFILLLGITVCFFVSMHTAICQTNYTDSILQKIEIEQNENKKVDLIISFYTAEFESNPNLIIETGLKLLKLSQKTNDKLEEASSYSILGHGYRLSGNSIKGLDYHHKALSLAENIGNQSIMAMVENQMAHIYKDREENDKAITLYLSASAHAVKGKSESLKIWPLMNLGAVYLNANKLDSSLMYSQRAYELSLQTNNKSSSAYILINLAGVQSKLGNSALAITYYNMAIKEASDALLTRHLNLAYTGLAQHYYHVNQIDSSEFYAKKAIAIVKNTVFFYLSIKPAKLLADMYENNNCDSTLKYSRIFKIANDTLYSSRANQQIQLMTFEEDLRQLELTSEKIIAADLRKENIQYALIALGIISFIILFLLLSRRHITNTKAIQFLGVVALLVLFEFLNLFLHPYLEGITHHSPLLMLLVLVCLAAILVPMHHKLEKWATHKLVEKNKQIRLANAKKTIQQLEK